MHKLQLELVQSEGFDTVAHPPLFETPHHSWIVVRIEAVPMNEIYACLKICSVELLGVVLSLLWSYLLE